MTVQITRRARAALLAATAVTAVAALAACSSSSSTSAGATGSAAGGTSAASASGGTYTFWDPYPQYNASSAWWKLVASCGTQAGVTIKHTGVTITRSKIDGAVGPNDASMDGVVIQDTTIDCHCPSTSNNSTPIAIYGYDFTLTRVNLFDAGHGIGPEGNNVIQDSYVHDLGGNTSAHKDGIYVGNGTNVTIKHNNIECNDGSAGGCTSAIGLLSDFGTITNFTIDNNLLNTNGSYCFYGGGGPSKPYQPNHIAFTNNHFGRKDHPQCGAYGPVTYFDSSASGNVWSGNVWDDTGATVPPEN